MIINKYKLINNQLIMKIYNYLIIVLNNLLIISNKIIN